MTSTMRLLRRKEPTLLSKVMAFVIGFLFLGLVGSCLIAIAIWPGEMKLVAPLFCSDAQPDAFVVTDTYSVQPGETTTNFTLYCMGPRGDATDKGFLLPFLVVSALNGTVLMTALLVLSKLGEMRRGPRTLVVDTDGETVVRWSADAEDAVGGRGVAIDDDDRNDDDDVRSPPPPGSTAGPFVD